MANPNFIPAYSTNEVYVGEDTSVCLTDELDAITQRMEDLELTPGPQGPQGPAGEAGADGQNGQDGQDGANGITPHIGTNGNWFIGETDTGVAAQGPAGADGADFNGNLVGGILRLQGNQAAYFSGTQEIFGSNNWPTRIAGNAITATKSIQVDSDERLKDVDEIDKDRLVSFMKKIKFVGYTLKSDEKKAPHFGVLAQQLLSIDEEIAKYFVTMGEDGFYAVDYTALALIAMLALQ